MARGDKFLRAYSAEDIAHNIWLKLFENKNLCENKDGSVELKSRGIKVKKAEGYLKVVVLNELNSIRKKEKYIISISKSFDSEDSSIFEKMKHKWLQNEVKNGINNLPKKQKSTATEFFIHGKTTKEIAQELGVRSNVISSRVSTIKKKLMVFLDKKNAL